MENLDFEWSRCLDEYEIVEEKGADHRPVLVIRPRSQRFETYKPLRLDGAFMAFATVERTPAGFVDFANRFGLLHHPREPEPIAVFYAEHDSLKTVAVPAIVKHDTQAVNLFDVSEIANDRPPLIRLNLSFRDGRPVLAPRDLRDALWLQFAVSITKREKFKVCLFCGTWFAYGTGTNHRETAIYCSSKCQQTHAYRKRKGLTT